MTGSRTVLSRLLTILASAVVLYAGLSIVRTGPALRTGLAPAKLAALPRR